MFYSDKTANIILQLCNYSNCRHVFIRLFLTHFSSESWSSSSAAASSATSPHHNNAEQERAEASCAKEVATLSWSSTVAQEGRAGRTAGNTVAETKTQRETGGNLTNDPGNKAKEGGSTLSLKHKSEVDDRVDLLLIKEPKSVPDV